ncbi:MAG TPA: hypothetical protein VFM09_13805 [Marmoricola sp.]|nr:hypothetical protein [Marmoricola sp.]
MRSNSRRSLGAVAAAGVATLALAGCGVGASAAAHINGKPVPTTDVDLLARITCTDLANSQASIGTNTRAVSIVRGQAVQALIDADAADMMAHQRGTSYDKKQLAMTMAQVDNALPQLPASDRAAARDLVERLVRAGLEVQQIGHDALVAQGEAHPSSQAATAKGQQLQRAFEKKADVQVDPRYATAKSATGDQMSVPVSSFARQGAASQPSQLWTIQLPAAQRCG